MPVGWSIISDQADALLIMSADCKLGTSVLESREGISNVRKYPKCIPYREFSDVQGKALICTKTIYEAASWAILATLTPVLWQFSGMFCT